jgi:hypothetical protein
MFIPKYKISALWAIMTPLLEYYWVRGGGKAATSISQYTVYYEDRNFQLFNFVFFGQ